MKIINIQIQFSRVPKLNKNGAIQLFCVFFVKSNRISEMKIIRKSEYTNILYKASNIKELWTKLQKDIFRRHKFSPLLRQGSIVVCEGKNSWKDYLLLHHYDDNQKIDAL